MLDTGPLGRIAHPRPNLEIITWFQGMLNTEREIIIPEIVDYELRRSLILEGLTKSIKRLDELKRLLRYSPIKTEIMLKAAELWAEVRKTGMPTADPKELDGDVILAAQAIDAEAIVVTENVGHLNRLIEARHWKEISI